MIAPTPKVTARGQLRPQPHSGYLHDCDRITSEGAAVARIMFPSNLRLVGRVPGVSMFGVSRARQHGGAVATVGLYLLAMKASGRPREAAEHALAWLQGLVDWLYCASGAVPTDDEILEASRAETDAEHAGNRAQLLLHEGITKHSLDQCIEAIEHEEARLRNLKLLLRRRRAAER